MTRCGGIDRARGFSRAAHREIHAAGPSTNPRSTIMNQPITRTILRWIHIICGIPILGYIYDSPSDTHNYAFSVRFLFLPVLLLSGLWMWKGHVFRRLLSKRLA